MYKNITIYKNNTPFLLKNCMIWDKKFTDSGNNPLLFGKNKDIFSGNMSFLPRIEWFQS
jgi:hypothetical protein